MITDNPFFSDNHCNAYISQLITKQTHESALELVNIDSFRYSALYKDLGMNQSAMTTGNKLNQATYVTSNYSTIVDGHIFRGKHSSPSGPPVQSGMCKVSLYLIPEDSAYVGGYSAISIDCFIEVYKLLGARSVCTNDSLYWLKGNTSKLGLQLILSAVKCEHGDYHVETYDFMTADSNKYFLIKLLHMFLASYSYINNLYDTSDLICKEFSDLIYNNIVLPWSPNVSKTISDEIKYSWLKHHLIL
jgi:hypothetical protein